MSQINILCYGDSNTWGYVPKAEHGLIKLRYARDIRWPGLLQKYLGNDFHIIEEGLNSRTTNLEYVIPPDRNGKTYLSPCLYSHAPLDLVVLALGGNDAKTYFNRNASQISKGLEELVDIIQASSYGVDMVKAPQVLITTCAIPHKFIEAFKDENGEMFLKGAVKKAYELVDCYAQLAAQKNCHFIDLSKEVFPSTLDGVHYDEAAHQKCAEILCHKIQEIFNGGSFDNNN